MSWIRGYLTYKWNCSEINSKLNQDGRGHGLTDEKRVLVYPFYSSLSCKACHQLPRLIAFFPFGCMRTAFVPHSPVEVFLLEQRGTEEECGKGFLSLTVIMQLVFECSYHTNVDHHHFQSCVPVSFSIVVFISPCPNVCSQPSGSQRAAHFSAACTFILEADVGIWV